MKNSLLLLFLIGSALVGRTQDTYTLTEGSALSIDGTSTVSDWTVTANTMEGRLQEDSGTLSSVVFSVPVSDIESGRAEAMDTKMHEALKQEEHPKVTFSVKNAKTATGGNQELKGTMNIAGVENQVVVPATITKKDGAILISGERKITLKDYDIEPPSAMFGSIVVGEEVTVKFDLEFTKS